MWNLAKKISRKLVHNFLQTVANLKKHKQTNQCHAKHDLLGAGTEPTDITSTYQQ